ncbi:MAG: MATE family efflux transporter [Elainella sp. Prado103]|nr:MATE family efflux transporter [Elainella sp. Prado103]
MKTCSIQTQLLSEIQACLQLALPLAGAQLAQAATAFVDTLMMGMLGSAILGAGGLGASIFQSVILVSSGIVAALSPIVASAYGAQQPGRIRKAVQQGVWLALLLALPIVGLLVWADQWLPWLGQSPATIQLAMPYLRSIAWGVVPVLVFAVLRNFVAALSDPRPVILIVVVGTLFNIVANYVLMFGKLGLPALGLAGIGWASALSLWGMLAAIIGYIASQPRYRFYQVFRGWWRFEPAMFQELLRLGLPIGVLSAVETGMFLLTMLLMGTLGTIALAAHQVVLQTAAITFMVPLGISLATTIRVGQQLGQQNRSGARLAGLVGIGIATLFMSLMGMLFWLLPERIIGLYLDLDRPDNAAVITLAQQLLQVAAVFQVVDGIQVCATGALRGLKDTQIPMLIGIIAYWGIGLTSGYWLGIAWAWGGVGLWWGLAIGLAVAAVVLTWRFCTMPLQQLKIGLPDTAIETSAGTDD